MKRPTPFFERRLALPKPNWDHAQAPWVFPYRDRQQHRQFTATVVARVRGLHWPCGGPGSLDTAAERSAAFSLLHGI